MKRGDSVTEIWYDLFLDLWNQRYRLEQQPRELLDTLAHQYGDAGRFDDVSVIVTSLLLRARADFAELDAAIRDTGALTTEKSLVAREQAKRIHQRWRSILLSRPVESDVLPPAAVG